jgi:hypothetical protein
MRKNKVKIEVLILTGKSIYVVGGLAIIGAAAIAKTTSKGIHKVKTFIKNGASKKEEKKEQEES